MINPDALNNSEENLDLSSFDDRWQKEEAQRQEELTNEEGLTVKDLAEAIKGTNNFQELCKVLGEQKQKQLLTDNGIKWKISDAIFFIERIDGLTQERSPTKEEAEYMTSNLENKALKGKVSEFLEKRIKNIL